MVQAGTRFDIIGDGPALVLVHGVGLDLTMWAPLVEPLAQRFTVVRYDLLGHGGSAKPPGPLTLRSFVGQLRALARYLELDRFALVGFSMGAMVAQAYAVEETGRLSRLVLLNGVHARSDDERSRVRDRLRIAERDGPRAIVEAALTRWFTAPFRASHGEAIDGFRRRLEDNDRHGFLAAYRVFAEADAELAPRLAEIRCPTMVATGEHDGNSTPAMARRMAAEIPGARCEILPGLAHMTPVEGAPAVAGLLREFLTAGGS